ncbi:EpsG family protein [Cetobacterium sp.]
MNVYSFIFLISYIAGILKMNKYFKQSILVILIIFLTTSYTSGSDWRTYELMHRYFDLSNFYNYYSEKGFSLYIALSKYIITNFWYFFIINKLIVAYLFYKVIKRYSQNILLAYSVFFAAGGIFLFIDCPFRNLLGIGIFLYSTKYIEKSKVKYILCILLGGSFHTTIIIVGLLSLIDFSRLKNIFLFFIIGVEIILSYNIELVMKILKKLPIYQHKLAFYLTSDYFNGNLLTFGMFEKFIILCILIFNKEKVIKKLDKKFFNYVYLYIIFYIIATKISILTRLVYYVQIFYLIFVCFIPQKIYRIKLIYIVLFIYYYLISLGQTSSVHMKYDTYLLYFFREIPYEIRIKMNNQDYRETIKKEIFLKNIE